MICTPCCQEIPEGHAAIFGLDRGDGQLVFGWTCCHKPVGDVAVVLASAVCVDHWLKAHPEDADEIGKLLHAHAHA